MCQCADWATRSGLPITSHKVTTFTLQAANEISTLFFKIEGISYSERDRWFLGQRAVMTLLKCKLHCHIVSVYDGRLFNV